MHAALVWAVAAPCTRTVLSAHGAQHEAMWPCLRPRPRMMLCGFDPSGVKVLLLLLQMGALRAGLDGTPLVLIQGPPGTGGCKRLGDTRQHTAGPARVASLVYVYVQQACCVVAGGWRQALCRHHLLASFCTSFGGCRQDTHHLEPVVSGDALSSKRQPGACPVSGEVGILCSGSSSSRQQWRRQ